MPSSKRYAKSNHDDNNLDSGEKDDIKVMMSYVNKEN